MVDQDGPRTSPDRGTELREITDPRVVKAMGHPLRMKILSCLDEARASPRELSSRLSERLGTVSYHVRTLADLGLIEMVDSRPRRGAVEHFYRPTGRWVVPDRAWGRLPRALRHTLSQQILDQIAEDLDGAWFDLPQDHLSRVRLHLDSEAREDLAKALDNVMSLANKLSADSLSRSTQDSLTEVGLAMLSFRPQSGGSAG